MTDQGRELAPACSGTEHPHHGSNGKNEELEMIYETTTVEIADHTGHTVAQMTREQVQDLSSDSERWIFARGRRVSTNQLAEADWSSIGTISVMPRIVYG